MSKLIPLSNGKYSTVSDWKYESVMFHDWRACFTGTKWYAVAKIDGKSVYLHRFIMDSPKGLDVHHINKDTFCNDDYNLLAMHRSDHRLIDQRGIILPYNYPPDPIVHNKTEILLLGGGKMLVDEVFWDRLYANRWHLHYRPGGYTKVVRGVGLRMIYSHREIMEYHLGRPLLSSEIVDHWNLNTSDNRLANLRLTDKSGNGGNLPVERSNNTTGFKGVTFMASRNKFVAQLTKNYKHITIGYYDNPEDAAVAYDLKAIELFGQFARTNFPISNYLSVNVQA